MLGHGLKAVNFVLSNLPVFDIFSPVCRDGDRESFALIVSRMTANPPPSVISPPLPLLTRLDCAAKLWFFKFFVTMALGLLRFVKRGEVNAVKPTYTKRYDVRPMLENRVFIPKNWKAGSKLPLYIDIHGGGFALCDPQTGTVTGPSMACHKLTLSIR